MSGCEEGRFASQADPGWVVRQTNAALVRDDDVVEAERLLTAAGLFLHPDRPKRWDEAVALFHADRLTDSNALVLDAGGEYYSTFLPNMRRLGRERLVAINTAFNEARVLGGVEYRPGDVTGSDLPSSSFGFVACLSVIEHGVPLGPFFQEQARLLRPGGHLFVSCDYWDVGVDVGNRQAYGHPVRVFDRSALEDIVCTAAEVGLALTGPSDWSCRDRVVSWKQMDLQYTFASMLFRV